MGFRSILNTEMIDSPILEDEFLEATLNEELKFKEGYQAIRLKYQIPILYPG